MVKRHFLVNGHPKSWAIRHFFQPLSLQFIPSLLVITACCTLIAIPAYSESTAASTSNNPSAGVDAGSPVKSGTSEANAQDSFADSDLAAEEEEILRVLKKQQQAALLKPVSLTQPVDTLSNDDVPLGSGELLSALPSSAKDGKQEPAKDQNIAQPAVAASLRAPTAPPSLPSATGKPATKEATPTSPTKRFEATIQQQQKSLASLRSAKQSLEGRVIRAESKLSSVLEELEKTKEQLLLAETEVERLSHLIEKRNIESLRKLTGNASLPPAVQYQKNVAPRKSAVSERTVPAEANEQLPVATVIVDKANLRTGPGANNSVLLSVSKDSRLVVEKRQGSWYRVIAPTGERAWISSDVVNFGPTADGRPTPLVRVKGITEEQEGIVVEKVEE